MRRRAVDRDRWLEPRCAPRASCWWRRRRRRAAALRSAQELLVDPRRSTPNKTGCSAFPSASRPPWPTSASGGGHGSQRVLVLRVLLDVVIVVVAVGLDWLPLVLGLDRDVDPDAAHGRVAVGIRLLEGAETGRRWRWVSMEIARVQRYETRTHRDGRGRRLLRKEMEGCDGQDGPAEVQARRRRTLRPAGRRHWLLDVAVAQDRTLLDFPGAGRLGRGEPERRARGRVPLERPGRCRAVAAAVGPVLAQAVKTAVGGARDDVDLVAGSFRTVRGRAPGSGSGRARREGEAGAASSRTHARPVAAAGGRGASGTWPGGRGAGCWTRTTAPGTRHTCTWGRLVE